MSLRIHVCIPRPRLYAEFSVRAEVLFLEYVSHVFGTSVSSSSACGTPTSILGRLVRPQLFKFLVSDLMSSFDKTALTILLA